MTADLGVKNPQLAQDIRDWPIGLEDLVPHYRAVLDFVPSTAGDGDFEDAISYVKSELHKEVWVCGSQSNLSTDLQSYSDNVLWLEEMIPAIDK